MKSRARALVMGTFLLSSASFAQQLPSAPAGQLPGTDRPAAVQRGPSATNAGIAATKAAPGRRTPPFGQMVDAVELRPIFNNDGSLLSFPIGLGVSAEAEIRGKWSWTAELDHFQLGPKGLSKDDGFYIQDVDLDRRFVMSTAAFGGLRYYTDPSGESLYAGAKLGFRRTDGTYQFGGSDVLEVSHYAPLVLESGYRVVAGDNVTVRVGARVAREFSLGQQLQTKKKSEDSLKLEAVSYVYGSIVDIGVGYYF